MPVLPYGLPVETRILQLVSRIQQLVSRILQFIICRLPKTTISMPKAAIIMSTASIIILSACEPQSNTPLLNSTYSRGVFIVNEGQFLASNASISFIDPQKDSVYNHIFYAANQVPLGDVAHSLYLHQDEAYIVVNNSGKIYRTDRNTLEFSGKITGLHSPRYLAITNSGSSQKAYVSDLYSGRIMVLDPRSDQVIDSIDISAGGHRLSSEQMILHSNKLFVTCWSYSDQVLVIDTETDNIIDSIKVGKQPNSITQDKNGDLWVLSDGGYPYSPYGQERASLTRIDPDNHNTETMKTWDDIRVSPIDLCINLTGDSLYLIGEGVYKTALDMTGFDKPLIPENGMQIYSLGIDPAEGIIYIGDAIDFQQDGWVHRYTSSGRLIDSFRVGVNPGHFSFTVQGNL